MIYSGCAVWRIPAWQPDMEEKGRYVMGYQRITNLQRDGLQKVIRMERDFS